MPTATIKYKFSPLELLKSLKDEKVQNFIAFLGAKNNSRYVYTPQKKFNPDDLDIVSILNHLESSQYQDALNKYNEISSTLISILTEENINPSDLDYESYLVSSKYFEKWFEEIKKIRDKNTFTVGMEAITPSAENTSTSKLTDPFLHQLLCATISTKLFCQRQMNGYGYPSRKKSEAEAIQDFQKLRDIPQPATSMELGKTCSNFFTEEARVKAVVCTESLFDNFENTNFIGKIHRKLVENSALPPNFFIRKMHNDWVPSQFSPIYMKQLISDLNELRRSENKPPIRRVFNGCGGWGDRLVAALGSDLDYYGETDPNEELLPLKHRMIKTLFSGKILNESTIPPQNTDKYETVQMTVNNHLNKSMNVDLFTSPVEQLADDMLGNEHQVQMTLTSPPYFNKEVYQGNNLQQSAKQFPTPQRWVENFLVPFIHKNLCYLEAGGYFCVNIANIRTKNKYLPLADIFTYIMENSRFNREAYPIPLTSTYAKTLNNHQGSCTYIYQKRDTPAPYNLVNITLKRINKNEYQAWKENQADVKNCQSADLPHLYQQAKYLTFFSDFRNTSNTRTISVAAHSNKLEERCQKRQKLESNKSTSDFTHFNTDVEVLTPLEIAALSGNIDELKRLQSIGAPHKHMPTKNLIAYACIGTTDKHQDVISYLSEINPLSAPWFVRQPSIYDNIAITTLKISSDTDLTLYQLENLPSHINKICFTQEVSEKKLLELKRSDRGHLITWQPFGPFASTNILGKKGRDQEAIPRRCTVLINGKMIPSQFWVQNNTQSITTNEFDAPTAEI